MTSIFRRPWGKPALSDGYFVPQLRFPPAFALQRKNRASVFVQNIPLHPKQWTPFPPPEQEHLKRRLDSFTNYSIVTEARRHQRSPLHFSILSKRTTETSRSCERHFEHRKSSAQHTRIQVSSSSPTSSFCLFYYIVTPEDVTTISKLWLNVVFIGSGILCRIKQAWIAIIIKVGWSRRKVRKGLWNFDNTWNSARFL